jgi:archaellum component FlaC
MSEASDAAILAELRGSLRHDIADARARLTSIERQLGCVYQAVGGLTEHVASVRASLDRLDESLRRLDPARPA